MFVMHLQQEEQRRADAKKAREAALERTKAETERKIRYLNKFG